MVDSTSIDKNGWFWYFYRQDWLILPKQRINILGDACHFGDEKQQNGSPNQQNVNPYQQSGSQKREISWYISTIGVQETTKWVTLEQYLIWRSGTFNIVDVYIYGMLASNSENYCLLGSRNRVAVTIEWVCHILGGSMWKSTSRAFRICMAKGGRESLKGKLGDFFLFVQSFYWPKTKTSFNFGRL